MRKRSTNDGFYVDISSSSSEVTGSCIHVTVKYPNNKFEHFIVDCGMFQELSYQDLNPEMLFNPQNVDFALITHNHIDHIGRLPLLVKNGFSGSIYTTADTALLMPIALEDTVSILNQSAKKKGLSPLYTKSDADKAVSLTQGFDYDRTISVSKNIDVTFFKNGHLIGAALILVTIHYYGCDDINLLFTGDYNNYNPFFAVPKIPKCVNRLPLMVICESTYGYMESNEVVQEFETNITEFFNNHPTGTVIVPAFALGRSQEILKKLRLMQVTDNLKNTHIYLDGNLTHRYTSLFEKRLLSSIDSNKYDFLPEGLEKVHKDTRATLLEDSHQKIIVSSSGMGSFGPAHLYIQNYIDREDSLIHFTGYCAEGTLSRQLYEAKEDDEVTICKQPYIKKASIKFTNEFSAHAKADELLGLLNQFKDLKLVLVTHGQAEVKKQFADRIFEEVNTENVEVLSRERLFRVGPEGLIKTMTTKF